MDVLNIFFWIAIFSGSLLILLLLLAIAGGDTDMDTESGGGVGVIKGSLAFLAVAAWVARMCLIDGQPTWQVAFISILSGTLMSYILATLFKFLLSQEHRVTWTPESSIGETGKVYLTIAPEKSGIVTVEINGINREIKAKSLDLSTIKTGLMVDIVDFDGEFVLVSPIEALSQ